MIFALAEWQALTLIGCILCCLLAAWLRLRRMRQQVEANRQRAVDARQALHEQIHAWESEPNPLVASGPNYWTPEERPPLSDAEYRQQFLGNWSPEEDRQAAARAARRRLRSHQLGNDEPVRYEPIAPSGDDEPVRYEPIAPSGDDETLRRYNEMWDSARDELLRGLGIPRSHVLPNFLELPTPRLVVIVRSGGARGETRNINYYDPNAAVCVVDEPWGDHRPQAGDSIQIVDTCAEGEENSFHCGVWGSHPDPRRIMLNSVGRRAMVAALRRIDADRDQPGDTLSDRIHINYQRRICVNGWSPTEAPEIEFDLETRPERGVAPATGVDNGRQHRKIRCRR